MENDEKIRELSKQITRLCDEFTAKNDLGIWDAFDALKLVMVHIFVVERISDTHFNTQMRIIRKNFSDLREYFTKVRTKDARDAASSSDMPKMQTGED